LAGDMRAKVQAKPSSFLARTIRSKARIADQVARSAATALGVLLALCASAAAQTRGTAAPIEQPNLDALFPRAEEWLEARERESWLIHGSANFIWQAHPRFRSPYRGPNSLGPQATQENTLSLDLVLGRRLWEGAEFIMVPQLSRGFGFSNARGVAAFPNGEAFRLGSTDPIGYFTRVFLRQTIALSGDTEGQDDDPMRFAGPLPRERITITVGKFSIWDVFDDNRYAHDPRTQFMNWALVGAGAFDFAADARGFTNGIAVEWENGHWSLRGGAFQVARDVNGLALDPTPLRGWQLVGQVDRFWEIEGRRGAARLLVGASRTNSARWRDLTAVIGDDAAAERLRNYRVKWMAAFNVEQEVARGIGIFARLSWNDGRSQNWMFTEMDWAVSGGVSVSGVRWGRPGDTFGLAGNVGGLTRAHRRFLEAGGIGFLTGDGRLRYRPEAIAETYYDARIGPGVNAALGYQFIANPAYNADRGPVSVFSLRLRAAF
ncbi:MAG TPA: carbohydrate porin, partial [Acetobacteraceae bacterium]|nr:carbohydrate porin [Acetobacteraceae bacterium]